MKFTPSRKQDDNRGGSCCDDDETTDRLKRIKHEPLSPPAYHSEEEQSDSSDESDVDEELIKITTRTGDTTAATTTTTNRTETKRDLRVGCMKIIQEIPNNDPTTTDKSGETSSDEDSQSRVGKRRTRSHRVAHIDSPDAFPLTSLTPPLEITPAIDEEGEEEDEQDDLNNSQAAFTDDGSTDSQLHHDHNHRHHHYLHQIPNYRRTSISRDRSDEMKLNEEQSEHLSRIIKAIKEGKFDDFSKLLNEKKDSIKILLNAFVDGQTALHYSLLYGRSPAWCKQLVMNGANPNQTNKAGWHPIHLAAYNGCPESMLYLIDCFAEW